MAILLNLVKSSVRVRTVDLPDDHVYHLSCHVLSSTGAMVVMNVLSRNASVQVPIMIRKLTNKGITMLCQHIYNSCTIAISTNEQYLIWLLCYMS